MWGTEILLSKFMKKEADEYGYSSWSYKDESRLHRLLSYILRPFNPDYLANYTTTFGTHTWFATGMRGEYRNMLHVEFHENVHKFDSQREFLWKIKYLYPQILLVPALLLLLLGWTGLILLLVVSVFLFTPVIVPPAVWRRNAELRGYIATAFHRYLQTGEIDNPEHYIPTFTGSEYYWMELRKDFIRNELTYQFNRMKRPDLFAKEWRWSWSERGNTFAATPYRMIRDFLTEEGLNRVESR